MKTKSVAYYKKKLDAVFSKYIRQRDKGKCYTCGRQEDPKRMQNGHFVPRQYLSVRYDERNNNCQCYACNMLYNGQPGAYSLNLRKQYGDGIIEELERNRHQVFKVDVLWYLDKIKYYENKLTEFDTQIIL